MDIPKTQSVSVDYKNRTDPSLWQTRLFAKVVLIDKTQDDLHPIIYQLKENIIPTKEQLTYWKSSSFSLPDEAFDLVGEAVSIDKKKKEINLLNKNTLAYHYLIIACGANPILAYENTKFITAINTLIEALRVQPKIPASFATESQHSLLDIQDHQFSTPVPSKLKTFTRPRVCQAFNHNLFGPDLHTINRRLYEIHL